MGKFIEVERIVVEVKIGAELSNVIKECIVLAATEWRDVSFEHNGTEYCILVKDLFACCNT